MNRLLVPALAPLLLLAACEQKTANPAAPAQPAETRTVASSIATPTADTALTGFQHDPATDLSGYYFTETTVQAGNWKLTDLSIRDPATFATWEAGIRLPALPAGRTLRAAFEVDNILPAGEYGLVLAVEEVFGDERRYLDFVEHAMLVRVTSSMRTFSVVAPPVSCEVSAPAPAEAVAR